MFVFLTWHPGGKSQSSFPALFTVKLVRWMNIFAKSSSSTLNFSVANLEEYNQI